MFKLRSIIFEKGESFYLFLFCIGVKQKGILVRENVGLQATVFDVRIYDGVVKHLENFLFLLFCQVVL